MMSEALVAPPTDLLQPPAPPPDLQLHLVDDDTEDEERGSSSRRPSTSSLSRFRSCPQLASAVNTSQDSPGSDMAPITDFDGNVLHTAPASGKHNVLLVEGIKPDPKGVRSAAATPTPPSTPGSRRRDPMTSSYASRSQSNDASPASTPKQSRRSRVESELGHHLQRTYSEDCRGYNRDDCLEQGVMNYGGQGVKAEAVFKKLQDVSSRDSSSRLAFADSLDHLDVDRLSETDDGSSMHVTNRRHVTRHSRHQHQQNQLKDTNDSVEKCNRWLESLKLDKSDKIKSRSHIQLPPI